MRLNQFAHVECSFVNKYLFRRAGDFHLNFLLRLKYSDVIMIMSYTCCIKISILVETDHPVKERNINDIKL